MKILLLLPVLALAACSTSRGLVDYLRGSDLRSIDEGAGIRYMGFGDSGSSVAVTVRDVALGKSAGPIFHWKISREGRLVLEDHRGQTREYDLLIIGEDRVMLSDDDGATEYRRSN